MFVRGIKYFLIITCLLSQATYTSCNNEKAFINRQSRISKTIKQLKQTAQSLNSRYNIVRIFAVLATITAIKLLIEYTHTAPQESLEPAIQPSQPEESLEIDNSSTDTRKEQAPEQQPNVESNADHNDNNPTPVQLKIVDEVAEALINNKIKAPVDTTPDQESIAQNNEISGSWVQKEMTDPQINGCSNF